MKRVRLSEAEEMALVLYGWRNKIAGEKCCYVHNAEGEALYRPNGWRRIFEVDERSYCRGQPHWVWIFQTGEFTALCQKHAYRWLCVASYKTQP